MRDSVIFEVIKIFQQNPNERFRRNEIKIKLPEFVKKNYYDSELTRILQYLLEVNIIIHSPALSKKNILVDQQLRQFQDQNPTIKLLH
jgi:hypothetical protein